MEICPGLPVLGVQEVAGCPHHVEQDLLDVLGLVVELLPLGLQEVLDPAGQGPDDGHGRLDVPAVEEVSVGVVGQTGGEDVLQVSPLHAALQLGEGEGATVRHVRLGAGPGRGRGVTKERRAGPPGEAGRPGRAGLDGGLASQSPVPGQATAHCGRAVESLLGLRNVNQLHRHLGDGVVRVELWLLGDDLSRPAGAAAGGPWCGGPGGGGGGLGAGAGGSRDGDPGLHCGQLGQQSGPASLSPALLLSLESLRRVRDSLPAGLPQLLTAAGQEPGG